MFESFLHNSFFSIFKWFRRKREEEQAILNPYEIENNGYENYEVIKKTIVKPTYKDALLSQKQKQQLNNYHKYNTRSKKKKIDLGFDTPIQHSLPPKLGKT